MEEERASGILANMLDMLSLMPPRSGLGAAIDPLTILGEGGKVDCPGSAVPAKVG